jgi:hypothetical protein
MNKKIILMLSFLATVILTSDKHLIQTYKKKIERFYSLLKEHEESIGYKIELQKHSPYNAAHPIYFFVDYKNINGCMYTHKQFPN